MITRVVTPLVAMTLLPEPDFTTLGEAARPTLTTPGCLRISGETYRKARLGLISDAETQRWEAVLDGGAWRDFVVLEVQDEDPNVTMSFNDLPFVPPLLGRTQDRGELGGLLDAITEQLEGEAVMTTAGVDTLDGQDVYVLHRALTPTGWFAAASQDVWVTAEPRARRWHTEVRKARLRSGGTLRRAEFISEVSAEGVPTADSYTGSVGVGPFRLHLDQQSAYTMLGPCPVAPAAEPPAPTEDAAPEPAPAEAPAAPTP